MIMHSPCSINVCHKWRANNNYVACIFNFIHNPFEHFLSLHTDNYPSQSMISKVPEMRWPDLTCLLQITKNASFIPNGGKTIRYSNKTGEMQGLRQLRKYGYEYVNISFSSQQFWDQLHPLELHYV